MMKNIIGQSVYMTVALLIVLLAGEYFIPEDCYIKEDSDHPNRFVIKLIFLVQLLYRRWVHTYRSKIQL